MAGGLFWKVSNTCQSGDSHKLGILNLEHSYVLSFSSLQHYEGSGGQDLGWGQQRPTVKRVMENCPTVKRVNGGKTSPTVKRETVPKGRGNPLQKAALNKDENYRPTVKRERKEDYRPTVKRE